MDKSLRVNPLHRFGRTVVFALLAGLALSACAKGKGKRSAPEPDDDVMVPVGSSVPSAVDSTGGTGTVPEATTPMTSGSIDEMLPPEVILDETDETSAGGSGNSSGTDTSVPAATEEDGSVSAPIADGDAEAPATEVAVPAGDGGSVANPDDDEPGASDGGNEGPGPSVPGDDPDCIATCEAAGGQCVEGNVCQFDCSAEGSCEGEIACPNDFDCKVLCSGADSCAGRVKCPADGADVCDVQCGQDACKNGLECGGVTCNVSCGPGGCHGGISGGATNFNVDCAGDGSCNGGITCNATNCNLKCDGSGACQNGNVTISATNATLGCNGNGTCNGQVNCSASSCNISCNTGAGACTNYCANRDCP